MNPPTRPPLRWTRRQSLKQVLGMIGSAAVGPLPALARAQSSTAPGSSAALDRAADAPHPPAVEIGAELIRALKDPAQEVVELPAGHFSLKAGGNVFGCNAPKLVRGQGSRHSILTVEAQGDPACVLFSVAASGFTLQGVTLRLQSRHPGSMLIYFSGRTEHHSFDDVVFEGVADESSTSRTLPHGISVKSDGSVEDVRLTGCVFRHLTFGIFTPNNYSGQALNWKIDRCTFDDNLADDIELNSSDNPKRTWSNVSITHCTFQRPRRKYSAGAGFALGMDSAANVILDGCYISGYAREAVHVEDFVENIIVSNNIIENCASGISVYENESRNVHVLNNLISLPVAADAGVRDRVPKKPNESAIGIHVANPGRISSSTGLRVEGNQITGYDIGIYCPVDRGGEVRANTLRLCLVGFFLPPGSACRLSDNVVFKTSFAFESLNSSVGFNKMEDCDALLTPSSPPTFFPEGIQWSTTRLAAKPVDASTLMAEIPLELSGPNPWTLAVRTPSRKARDTYRLNNGGSEIKLTSATDKVDPPRFAALTQVSSPGNRRSQLTFKVKNAASIKPEMEVMLISQADFSQ